MHERQDIAPPLEPRAQPPSQPDLATDRVLAACTREMARLSAEVVRRVNALRGDEVTDEPVMRQVLDHCMVQLGAVAPTLTRLRSTLDPVADGELLVVAWGGTVGARRRREPERARGPGAGASATAVGEDVRVAAATSEEGWSWRPPAADVASLSWTQRAECCVAELRLAHMVDGHRKMA